LALGDELRIRFAKQVQQRIAKVTSERHREQLVKARAGNSPATREDLKNPENVLIVRQATPAELRQQ